MTDGDDELQPSRATEFDVASYILDSLGSITTLKLQMLLFYCQAFSLAWDERPLFEADFHAFDVGPKLASISVSLSGMFKAESILPLGDAGSLDEDGADTVDQVLKVFGDKSSQWLTRHARSEAPWRQAWETRFESEVGLKAIEKADIQAFYVAL